MKLAAFNGFEIHQPTTGGKAGIGRNVTSTLQVRQSGCIVKQFRYIADSGASRHAAMEKARRFILAT